ncbi:MAG: right-handed parallel beta-helix repeat-containing protein [Candidatus Heimdallarchaeum endolithica]|uniref:Probable pectate lyase C n=1 Tax=Candidatus Heimdallarchaeum endolithica TaxID=2876572 RepID=A0A9Y1BSL1_9ARCH|nr:MAG: right-handed parallel beta-helix repeat-containing protein [Candidatus Heimdallarchaeum endolithica]
MGKLKNLSKCLLFILIICLNISISYSIHKKNEVNVHTNTKVFSSLQIINKIKNNNMKNSYIIHAPISITSDSDLTVFPGSGTKDDPYIIKNYIISSSSADGIKITSTTKYIIIRDCYLSGRISTFSGIYIDSVVSGTIIVTNNTISNYNRGIFLSSSFNNTFISNTITNSSSYGFFLSSSSWNTFASNTIINSSIGGISLSSSFSNTFTSNNVTNSIYDGILLSFSSNNIFIYNNISFNDRYGIFCLSSNSKNNTFTSNIVTNSCSYGVYLQDSSNNTIVKNIFIKNNQATNSQAYDCGIDNRFYYGTTGNYWYDWSGTGVYAIDGTADNFDPYPMHVDLDQDNMSDKWEEDNGLDPLTDDSALDPDNDNLTNLEEYTNNTSPLDSDTDDDGLIDGDEVIIYLTDPLDPDTDNDGMLDGWEVCSNLNPLADDAYEDLDGDGLSNLKEFNLGTFANNTDSDDDGLIDGDEVIIYLTDPLDPDTDNDGLSDYEEINIYLTNPRSKDTDRDGRSDSWEIENGKDPLRKNVYLNSIVIGYIIVFTLFIILLLLLIYKIRKRVKIRKKMKKVINLKPKLIEFYEETFAGISSLIIFVSSVNEIRSFFEKLKIFLEDLLFIQINARRIVKNKKEQFNKLYNEIITFVNTELQTEVISLVDLINPANLEEYTKKVSTKLIHNWSEKKFKHLIISYEKLISFLDLVIVFREETLAPFDNQISSEPLWSKVNDLASEKLAIFQEVLKNYNNIFSELAEIIKVNKHNNMLLDRLKKISSVYNKISLNKLSPLLGFQDKEVMKLWLYAYSKDVPNRIEGEEVIFDLQFEGVLVSEDMTTAIDDLLKQFSEWERTGKGKKK